MQKQKILALITARTGSKRVPNKNFIIVGGKPLYRWTTELPLLRKGLVDAMALSSNQPEKFDVPDYIWKIQRPPKLCKDGPHAPVVRHALSEVELLHGYHFDYVLLLQPTNPFRKLVWIKEFIREGEDLRADYGYTIYEDANLQSNYIEGWCEDDKTPAVIRSGNMYWYSRSRIYGDSRSTEMFLFSLPKEYGYNINTPLDIYIANAMAEYIGRTNGNN